MGDSSYNFALIGAAGFVAPRHMRAILDTGNQLVAAVDPSDSVGILDKYFLDVKYFAEIERFDRHLEKLKRQSKAGRVHYVSICTPNYLHDAHVRLALRVSAKAICEKPLVINPWNLDQLQQLVEETNGEINTIMQLRLHPDVQQLKARLEAERQSNLRQPKKKVNLTYITGRGRWYHGSWKGSEERSGGLVTNIGVHFFDMLLWLFGDVQAVTVEKRDDEQAVGTLELKYADVRWLLSVDFNQLPFQAKPGHQTTYRSITIDGEEMEFTHGFENLHTRSYEEILKGNGFKIEDARPAIELVHKIRSI